MKYVIALRKLILVGLGFVCLEFLLFAMSFAVNTIFTSYFGRMASKAISYISLFPLGILRSNIYELSGAYIIGNALLWAVVSYLLFFNKEIEVLDRLRLRRKHPAKMDR
jgi:hypothetical protein